MILTFIDLETNSLNVKVADICEIGAVQYYIDEDGNSTRIGALSVLTNAILIPEDYSYDRLPVHTMKHCVYAIDAVRMVGELIAISDFICGHNFKRYDFNILKRYYEGGWVTSIYKVGGIEKIEIIDTLKLSRQFIPTLTSHKLGDVCDFLNIKRPDHRAYSDAVASAMIFFHLYKVELGLRKLVHGEDIS